MSLIFLDVIELLIVIGCCVDCELSVDCWQINRTSAGVIIPDPSKFPSGLPTLINYVKSKGFKFGELDYFLLDQSKIFLFFVTLTDFIS